MRTSFPGLLIFGLVAFALCARSAVFVTPTSYSSTSNGEGITEGGSFDYYDDTGSQLADGVTGGNDWFANFGNGPAYEWVGWRFAEPTITFNFSSTVTIQRILVGFNREDSSSIRIPTSIVVAGTDTFVPTGTEFPSGTRGYVEIPGSWTGSSLTLELKDGDTDAFIFSDEIQFEAVPEPAAVAWMAGSALAIFALYRRLRRSWSNAHRLQPLSPPAS